MAVSLYNLCLITRYGFLLQYTQYTRDIVDSSVKHL